MVYYPVGKNILEGTGMIVLGLTGGSGTGKGVVGMLLCEQGASCLDADAVYHALVATDSPCARELIRAFGPSVATAVGGIDRKALASLVFCGGKTQEERLALLNRISHKHILEQCRRWLAERERAGDALAVVDAPLLFESGFDKSCTRTLAVLAPRQTRLARVMIRDGISLAAAQKRIDAQPTDDFYISRADDCIINDASLDELREKVKKYLEKYIE